jgi:hypothetical protein
LQTKGEQYKNYNIYAFYLTSGYSSKISKYKLLKRDKESIKVLHKPGVKKNIIFLGIKLNIKVNRLYINLSKSYMELILFAKFIKPHR